MANPTWSKEQMRAITLRNQNVVVSAGAGSGKTTVLVERVMTLILTEPRADIHRLLIVTFTEAAAAEMRERIGKAISLRLEQAREADDTSLVSHLSRQASLLEVAHISTLHSFCMMMVRRNFVRLGLDPEIRIMADDEYIMLRRSVMERLLEDALRERKDEVRSMLSFFAPSDPLAIVPLVLRLDEFSRSQPNPRHWLKSVLRDYERASASEDLKRLSFTPFLYQWFLRQVEEASELFHEGAALASRIDGYEAYTAELEQLSSLVATVKDDVLEEMPLSEIHGHMALLLTRKSPRAPKDVEGDVVKDKRRSGLSRLKQVAQILDRGTEDLVLDLARLKNPVSLLIDFVLQFQERFAEQKRARGVLDYSDLEHYALLSVSDPTIGEAERMRRHFVEIFVDEYQDTSPIQDAIVEAIKRPAGNVFVVGDVKQSIYRFRMAEPKIFLAKQTQAASAEGSSAAVHLTDNYRSRSFVVDAVNDVFTKIFTPQFGGIRYDESARMRAGALYPDVNDRAILKGSVEVHLVERQAPQASEDEIDNDFNANPEDEGADGGSDSSFAPSAMEKEASIIATRISQWMGASGEERRKVWDKSRKEYRPLMYRDVVILLRSVRGRMNVILDVLRKFGIPAYGATTSGFFEAIEVKWMLATLTVLDNPYRELALATLLRSPLVGFSDDDLTRIRLQSPGNFYDALLACERRPRIKKNQDNGSVPKMDDGHSGSNPAPDSSVPQTLRLRIRRFLATFEAWRTQARRSTAASVIRTIYQKTGILDYVLGMEDGETRHANLQLLLNKAAAYDTTALFGAFGFARWMEESISQEIDAGEARTQGENEDVVRIMTIHQSKGLEFPVVFVADMGKQFYEDHGERITPLHPALGFGPEFLDVRLHQRWPTVASIAMSMANQTDVLAEEARILYVAMTRARDYLVLVGSASHLLRALERNRFLTVAADEALPMQRLLGARTYLDWLLPIWLFHDDALVLRELVNLHEGSAADDDEEMEDCETSAFDDSSNRSATIKKGTARHFRFLVWGLPNTTPIPSLDGARQAYASDEESSAPSPHNIASEELRQMIQQVAAGPRDSSQASESDALTTRDDTPVPSKMSATDLRRLWVATHAKGKASFQGRASAERLLRVPSAVAEESTTGRERGSAFHAIMQRIDLDLVRQGTNMSSLVSSLVERGVITRDTADAVDISDLASFFESDAGARVLAARTVWREHPFLFRLPVEGDDGLVDQNRFVVVQGVIDVLAKEDTGWLIVDYKTDNIKAADVTQTAFEYAAQVSVYRQAVLTLAKSEAVDALLYFVRPRITVAQAPLDLQELWAKS